MHRRHRDWSESHREKWNRHLDRPGAGTYILEELDPGIVPVGVFVNEDTNMILRIVRESGLKMIQLHGQEGEEMVRTIRETAACR